MQIEPVKDHLGPRYPTRQILDDHPELLRLIPKRWQTNPVVLTALAGICTLISGCRNSGAASTAPSVRVAPIFQHGEGRGGFGCVAINPPVVLSEDEARQIVINEAKQAGLSFRSGGPTLSKVRMPAWVKTKGREELGSVPLKMDGQDARRRIYFQFVSESEAYEWGEPPASTAYSVDTAGEAKRVRAKMIKSAPAGTYAVFYDPLVPAVTWRTAKGKLEPDINVSYEQAEKKAGKQARRDLRAQVRDFIKWLKAEGVI